MRPTPPTDPICCVIEDFYLSPWGNYPTIAHPAPHPWGKVGNFGEIQKCPG